jgi:hypothetical protein
VQATSSSKQAFRANCILAVATVAAWKPIFTFALFIE